jgi:peptidoglycan/xylan/chitin deacetylase (PgdA/CDA1 family)
LKTDPNLPGTQLAIRELPDTLLPAYRPRREWPYLLPLLAGFALLYFLTAQPIARSAPASRNLFALTASIATERSFYLDHFLTNPAEAFLTSPDNALNTAYFAGHYYFDGPPGAALLAVPFYQWGRLFGPDGPAAWVLIWQALAGAAALLAVFSACRRLGSGRNSAYYAVITLGAASVLWREAGLFGPGVFTLLLLALALWLAFPPLPRDQGPGRAARLTVGRGFALGLTLGFGVVVDYPNLAWTPLLVAYLLWSRRFTLKSAPALVVGWLVGLAPLAAYNTLAFGRPWTFSYGFLLNDPEARSLGGQFSGGFNPANLWDVFFGPDRAMLGLFVVLFGVWGLVAMFGQRGKRRETILLFALIIVALAEALLRRPLGTGQLRADFALGMMPPLALGVAVWHERFMFLTRLEQRWLPALATGGVGLYYLLAPPGPAANLDAVLYVLPLALFLALAIAAWFFMPRLNSPLKAAAGLALLALFGLIFTFLSGPARPAYAIGDTNNLLFNGQFTCTDRQYPGWFIQDVPARCTKNGPISVNTGQTLKPYLTPVQGGKEYRLEFDSSGPVYIDWVWTDEAHQPVTASGNQFAESWRQEWKGGPYADNRAAPPGAAYLQLVFTPGANIQLDDFALADDSVRVEPMPDYARAALAFSFDWESAMGGLIHSRGGTPVPGEGESSGGVAVNNQDISAAVADAVRRGYNMRAGADYLLSIFNRFGVKGTFYATGYNLLDGNPQQQQFVGNPTYKWANPQNGWGDNYWLTHPWYGQDPFSTDTDPVGKAWYFGDQTDRLNAAGQDIQSHTFGHLYVRGTTVQEFTADIDTFLQYAAIKKLPPIKSFAFPWKSSNSLTADWYNVLAQRGFTSVTRLYDQDQMVRNLNQGTLQFDNCKRTSDNKVVFDEFAGPCNTYFYLNQVKNVPQLAVLSDYQLETGDRSEATAYSLINQLLQRRGYGSIWTHPESIVAPDDQQEWARVVQYATGQRAAGLYVDSVSNLIQYRKDSSQVAVAANWESGGKKVSLTVTNHARNALDGVTLTLPATIRAADGSAGFKGSQLLVPTIQPGQSLTIDIDF